MIDICEGFDRCVSWLIFCKFKIIFAVIFFFWLNEWTMEMFQNNKNEKDKNYLTKLTIKIGVVRSLDVSAGSEIDELELERLQIDQQVFILDVPMDDALPMASHHRLDNLSEKVSGQLLFQTSLLCDEIEEVFAGLRPLHDDDEGVMTFVTVDQSDDAGRASGHHVHQTDLHGNALAVHLKNKRLVKFSF